MVQAHGIENIDLKSCRQGTLPLILKGEHYHGWLTSCPYWFGLGGWVMNKRIKDKVCRKVFSRKKHFLTERMGAALSRNSPRKIITFSKEKKTEKLCCSWRHCGGQVFSRVGSGLWDCEFDSRQFSASGDRAIFKFCSVSAQGIKRIEKKLHPLRLKQG